MFNHLPVFSFSYRGQQLQSPVKKPAALDKFDTQLEFDPGT